MASIKIPVPELAEGATLIVECAEGTVLLCRVGGTLRALDGMCPHQEMSLEGSRIRSGMLICPHHGGRFHLDDGRSMTPLTKKGLKLLDVKLLDDEHLEIEMAR